MPEPTRDVITPTPPYDAAKATVDNLQHISPQIDQLLSWFPNRKKQLELDLAGKDEKVKFITEALGHHMAWEKAVQHTNLGRPQIKHEVAARLETTDDDITQFGPTMTELDKQFGTYIADLIDHEFKGDISPIVNNLKTAGQALGLNYYLVGRTYRIPDQKLPNFNVWTATGRQLTNHGDVAVYLDDDANLDDSVLNSSYDKETNTINFTVSSNNQN